eukprot:CAMPEP_0170550218 /NCGR_PEP_ID=MMETSP0211-20121228/8298_1 /TAXON_ID=311385 /ORGANISM="Pseudokeronopsis sp., Strain OXSARD2" /LENGTH=108 /DNA_ID=CAMNT_0010856649 /DNA_START=520 /DNA_END=846 /DNA_ORIENTATION=+
MLLGVIGAPDETIYVERQAADVEGTHALYHHQVPFPLDLTHADEASLHILLVAPVLDDLGGGIRFIFEHIQFGLDLIQLVLLDLLLEYWALFEDFVGAFLLHILDAAF